MILMTTMAIMLESYCYQALYRNCREPTNPWLLLRNVVEVTTIQKPRYLLHIPTMAISMKFLNSNPDYIHSKPTPTLYQL